MGKGKGKGRGEGRSKGIKDKGNLGKGSGLGIYVRGVNAKSVLKQVHKKGPGIFRGLFPKIIES